MNNDTPRTDAAIDSMMLNRVNIVGSHMVFTQMVLAEHARTLERENQQLRDGLKQYQDAIAVKDKTLCFFSSVIKCGESWTDTCETEFRKALSLLSVQDALKGTK